MRLEMDLSVLISGKTTIVDKTGGISLASSSLPSIFPGPAQDLDLKPNLLLSVLFVSAKPSVAHFWTPHHIEYCATG